MDILNKKEQGGIFVQGSLLNSNIRNDVGSNACNRLRNTGCIPGVMYGRFFTNHSIQLDSKELNNIIKNHGESAVVQIVVDGITYPAMIKEVQRDVMTGKILHVDLQQVYATEKIHTAIPVLLAGKEKVNRDGVLQQQLKKVEIECYPANVPKFVSIDVSDLGIGGTLRVSDVEFGEDFTVLNDAEEVIVSLSTVNNVDVDEEEEEASDAYNSFYTPDVDLQE